MTLAALYDERPIVIALSRKLISALGYEKAVFLQQVHYWIHHSSIKNKFPDEKGVTRNWVYNTYAQCKEELCYSSEITVRRMIGKLEKDGLILSREGQGRMKYYTIDYEKLSYFLSDNMGQL